VSYLGYARPTTTKATRHPTVRDLEWAAGFLDGEGCFGINNSNSERVSATQDSPQLLRRLQLLFGGTVSPAHRKPKSSNQWTVYGTRARGVMLTLYTLLSDKRKAEIAQALRGEN